MSTMSSCFSFRLPPRAPPPSPLRGPPQDPVVCRRPPGLSYISRTAHPNALLLLVSHQLHAGYTAPIRAAALHSSRLSPLVLHSASFHHVVTPPLSSIRRVSLDVSPKAELGALSPVDGRACRAAAMAASALELLKVFVAVMGRYARYHYHAVPAVECGDAESGLLGPGDVPPVRARAAEMQDIRPGLELRQARGPQLAAGKARSGRYAGSAMSLRRRSRSGCRTWRAIGILRTGEVRGTIVSLHGGKSWPRLVVGRDGVLGTGA